MLLYILIPLVCFFIWCLQKATDRAKGLPPGPFRFPVIGSTIQVLREDPTFPFIAIQKLRKYYGNVFTVQLGLTKGVAIVGYDAVSKVYHSDDWIGRMDEKWQLDRTYDRPIGLITAHSNVWRETRRFSTRGLREFGFGVKKTMDSLLQDELQEFLVNTSEKIKENDGKLPVSRSCQTPFINVTWSMLTGTRFHYDDPKLHLILNHINYFFKSGALGAGLLISYPFLIKIIPRALGFDIQQKATRAVHQYIKDVLVEARADSEYKTNPKTFIEVFLQKIDTREATGSIDDDIYSDENLISVLYDFLFGAAETASNTLEFGILRMVLNEDIMQKVVQEIDAVIGSRLPCLADREKMIYTEATILEIHRISNVVPLGPRKLEKDASIGKFRVPKGTTVFLSNYSVAMDPEFWGDPLVFRPERFISQDGKIINGDKFFPFGAGKRNCIAESVAKATIFILFTGLFQKFNFSVDPKEEKPSTEPVLGFSMSPKHFSILASSRY